MQSQNRIYRAAFVSSNIRVTSRNVFIIESIIQIRVVYFRRPKATLRVLQKTKALSSERCCSILQSEVCGYFAVFLVAPRRLSSDWLEQRVGDLDDARKADNQTCYECQASRGMPLATKSGFILFQRPVPLSHRFISLFFSLSLFVSLSVRFDICVPAR